jgi:acetyltransferase-like isoleucine patch superfamily enzyme
VLHLFSFLQARWYGFKRFGKGSFIKPLAVRISGVKHISIGRNCFFGSGLILVAVEELHGRRHEPMCLIGDGCAFGEDFVLSCTSRIMIGNNVLASTRVFIADSYHGYEDTGRAILNQPMAGDASVIIGDGSFLGIGCAVLPGVTLGRNCVVGANAVVTKSFPDFSVVVGNPARLIKRYDPVVEKWVVE